MPDAKRLTPEQWVQARRRWEGSDAAGFDWLLAELVAAFGVTMTRQGVSVRAKRDGWEKGGEPSKPLADVAQHGKADVAQRAVVAQHTKPSHKIDAEPVDLPPGEKPPGYAGTGRPSLYRPEYDAMILDYFNKEPFQDVEVQAGNGTTKMQRMVKDPPMLSGFANSIGVSMSTVNRWGTDVDLEGRFRYPSFAAAYARAREMNESMFARGAALGLYDGRFVQFILKNLYGWQDQPLKAADVAMPSKAELEERYIKVMDAARAKRAAVIAERAHLWADDA